MSCSADVVRHEVGKSYVKTNAKAMVLLIDAIDRVEMDSTSTHNGNSRCNFGIVSCGMEVPFILSRRLKSVLIKVAN